MHEEIKIKRRHHQQTNQMKHLLKCQKAYTLKPLI